MDSQQHNIVGSQRARRGVSLIEVLVVLVILVTGILTIIRLFPSGFFSIQSAGNAALAEGLGGAAINRGAQDAQSLPEAILPGNNLLTLASASAAAMYSNYDPDNPNTLDNARIVSNETITVPTAVSGQSVYVVHYGPVVMPADTTTDITKLPGYVSLNSPYWTSETGDSTVEAVAGSASSATVPQERVFPGQERFLVDLTNKKIAVPYAPYAPDPSGTTFTLANGTIVREATSYSQKMIVAITCDDRKTYVQYLNVPAATHRDSTQPNAPEYVPSGTTSLTYLPDANNSGSGYQGGWFSPTADYQDNPRGVMPPSGVNWVSVTLHRPYHGVYTPAAGTSPAFGNDPYQFALLTGNIGGVTGANGANPGVIAFNPKAANGTGAQARKAQISYLVSTWSILHEDYDIPALSGSATAVVRTTVPNLLLAGSANPDNSINPGIAGSSSSIVILDLDSGQLVAPFSNPFDPTTPDKPINNEDVNGTMPDPTLINVSYSTGRIVFGSQVFTDGKPHRIRVFYTADLGWTVAVQKTPAYFSEYLTTPGGTADGTTALAADQFSYDAADRFLYFARCNAGKTVEIDGTYTLSGTTQGFSDTVAVSQVLNTLGDSSVRVDLTDGTKFEHPIPSGATVTFSAVRGLSARSVVAWKERNQYKVHSVDALLTRTP